MTGCSNNSENPAARSAEELSDYVDSVKHLNVEYSDDHWNAINAGYADRAAKAEAKLSEMKDNDKDKVAKAKEEFMELQTNYTSEIQKVKEKEMMEHKQSLRNALFGEGKLGSDMQFSFVTGQNAYSVYKNFVDVVDANKDNYSREDWDEIKTMYEALDTRKNEIEKNLTTGDNLKIAKEKVRFGTMYDFNRPGSKVEENADAKK